MILKTTNEEIQQLETCDFYTDGPSLFSGAIASEHLVFQVHRFGIKVLNSGNYSIEIL